MRWILKDEIFPKRSNGVKLGQIKSIEWLAAVVNVPLFWKGKERVYQRVKFKKSFLKWSVLKPSINRTSRFQSRFSECPSDNGQNSYFENCRCKVSQVIDSILFQAFFLFWERFISIDHVLWHIEKKRSKAKFNLPRLLFPRAPVRLRKQGIVEAVFAMLKECCPLGRLLLGIVFAYSKR